MDEEEPAGQLRQDRASGNDLFDRAVVGLPGPLRVSHHSRLVGADPRNGA
ncbi:MAG TPA: hypothetical protein VMI55_02235 [Thermoplasmata archaeon]|nr:hypothetical protein [Thermoplasmata archaeon]